MRHTIAFQLASPWIGLLIIPFSVVTQSLLIAKGRIVIFIHIFVCSPWWIYPFARNRN